MMSALVGCSEPPAAPTPTPQAAPAPTATPEPAAPAAEAVAAPEAAVVSSADGWAIEKPALSRVEAGPDAVSVTEAGAEPRAVLRFAPKAEQTRSVTLTMAMQVAMTLGTKAIDPSVLPTVEVKMDVTPSAASDGASTYAFAVTSATRSELDGASERLKKAMDTAVEGMADSKGTLHIDGSGRMSTADYGLPEVPTPGLRPSLAGFQQSFSQLFVVFPETPVGVGASWSSTSHFELSGIPVEQRATYTLKAREGDVLTLAVSFEQAASGDAAAPAGVALEGTQFGGRGTGTLTVALDSPFPTQAEAQSRSRVLSSVTMGGAAQPVEMDLLSTLSIAAPPA